MAKSTRSEVIEVKSETQAFARIREGSVTVCSAASNFRPFRDLVLPESRQASNRSSARTSCSLAPDALRFHAHDNVQLFVKLTDKSLE